MLCDSICCASRHLNSHTHNTNQPFTISLFWRKHVSIFFWMKSSEKQLATDIIIPFICPLLNWCVCAHCVYIYTYFFSVEKQIYVTGSWNARSRKEICSCMKWIYMHIATKYFSMLSCLFIVHIYKRNKTHSPNSGIWMIALYVEETWTCVALPHCVCLQPIHSSAFRM